MKKYIKYIAIILVIILIIVAIIIANIRKAEREKENEKFKIVTSFYPIYVMTLNITEGAQNIDLVNMADVDVGCIHDYTLVAEDVKKIEKADVFVQNGLGLEDFTNKIIESNKSLQVIDSSENIEGVARENEEINPHIWTSISNYIQQVENIANKLEQINPENAQVYAENSQEYIQKLEELKQRYNAELQNLNGQGAVILNESFEYLGKELGLNWITINTSHEESAISAETLKNVIEYIKQNQVKIIIVDEGDNMQNAETIANETGAKIYKLNSGITGSLSKDAYISSMSSNLENLKN